MASRTTSAGPVMVAIAGVTTVSFTILSMPVCATPPSACAAALNAWACSVCCCIVVTTKVCTRAIDAPLVDAGSPATLL